MSYVSTITAKGQTTVPKEIREKLKLKPGDRIEFAIDGDHVEIRRRNRRLVDCAGMLPGLPGKTVTIEEMDEAIAEAVLERYDRSRSSR